MATLYEIISYAGLNPNIPQDSKTVIDILENSKEYTLYKKGLFGTLTVDGDAKEIANYVKK